MKAQTWTVLLFLFTSSLAAQQTKTLAIDCWSGGHCALPCGGSGQGNYDCSDGTGGWTPTCAFTDPLPQGSTLTKLSATVWTHQCSSSSTWQATINGLPLSTITDGRSSCTCLNSPCLDNTHNSLDYPDGLPDYVYGGSNTFGLNVQSGVICVEHVDLTFTYSAGQIATITNTPPIIPRGSALRNNCVQYRSDLTGVVTKSGQPQSGVALRFRSSRGSPPDTITQPSSPTNSAGTATGRITTYRQGTASITDDNADVDTPNPLSINFQAADWEAQFLMTAYIIANEADYGGPNVTNPCGLTGTWRRGFLYGNGVLLQGSGQDLNGNIITIDWARSGSPLNQNNVCFTTATCAVTASGACATAGTTIAVDRAVIPMGASVSIQNVGNRVAQDTGGAIRGYHIDVFRGFGRASMQGWGNFNGTVRYLSGGGTCN
ncbi:MAG TPA: 3D domain-containing protein [Thermoanaerobaculia bacterium]|nr:3D domain-containing protein [Thermoanaerobaculia bacterium]